MSQSEVRRLPADLAWQRLVPSLPLLLGVLAFGRLLSERLAMLNDPDTYLHIAAGRWILAHGALPTHDPFSHSLPGADWLVSEWLAEIVLAITYDHAGWGGLILLTAASVAVAVALLMHFLLRQLPPLPALVAAAAAAALLLPHVLARPHVLALPLLVLWAGRLLAARDAARTPPFVLLPVMVLWANLHASFMFGLALAAFLVAEAVLQPGNGRSRSAAVRQWGLFVFAAVAAALLTPFGIAGLVQPVRLSTMPVLQANFVEWLSPDFQKSPALELWLLGMLLIGFASGLRLPWTRLLLLLGLVHMALQHTRHSDLLAIVAPLAVAAAFGGRLAELMARQGPSRLSRWFDHLARPAGLPAMLVALALAVALALPTALHPVVRGDDAVTPEAALAAAERLGLSGPVLNAEKFGGYLLFRGVPTLIDGRIEMYGNDFLAKHIRAETGDAAALDELLARYRVAWTLLVAKSGGARAMDHLPGWQQVYADEHAVIHRRSAEPR